jgi:hypothetical protein
MFMEKVFSFMFSRWPWIMPVLIKKFPARTSNKGVGCRKFMKYVTSLLRIYL